MDNTKPWLVRVSFIISTLFNPLLSLLFYFFYTSYYFGNSKKTTTDFLSISFILILPIVVWIFWNVKKGKYTDADVSKRSQRKSLYIVIVALLAIYIAKDFYFNDKLDLVFICLFLLFVLMMLSNFYIKSSMHTAFNLFVSALFLNVNPWISLAWLFVTILVAITRLILKRHQLSEIISGTIIALFVSFLYLYLQILTQQ